MQGSGTTILEANFSGRRAIGFDIDPLANYITIVKTTRLDPVFVHQQSKIILQCASSAVENRSRDLFQFLDNRWNKTTRDFVDYWFDFDSQVELAALIQEIEKIEQSSICNFFKAALSAIIITKTGGVSLALDLAHTRPHRAKLIYTRNGEILEGESMLENAPKNLPYMTKNLRSPIEEFKKRVQNNIKGLVQLSSAQFPVQILFGNAQELPLMSDTIDLIVTSPPYASNAIDYMRAHKFSLVWLGFPLETLSIKRRDYIGGEIVSQFEFEKMPQFTASVVSEISALDSQKGLILHRYFSEMTRVLREMYRILKSGKCAVVVVGNSEMRGQDTETQNCLADIGKSIGFEIPAIGVRSLDRDRRMLPVGGKIDRESQIQKRMHEEYVIGFYKPEK